MHSQARQKSPLGRAPGARDPKIQHSRWTVEKETSNCHGGAGVTGFLSMCAACAVAYTQACTGRFQDFLKV